MSAGNGELGPAPACSRRAAYPSVAAGGRRDFAASPTGHKGAVAKSDTAASALRRCEPPSDAVVFRCLGQAAHRHEFSVAIGDAGQADGRCVFSVCPQDAVGRGQNRAVNIILSRYDRESFSDRDKFSIAEADAAEVVHR